MCDSMNFGGITTVAGFSWSNLVSILGIMITNFTVLDLNLIFPLINEPVTGSICIDCVTYPQTSF